MTQLNPVVQKIAEQAKGFVDLNQHVGGDNGCMIYTYEGLNKFAELIVAECVKTVARQELMSFPEHKWEEMQIGYNDGIRTAAKKIKEHFGVELYF